MGRLYFCLKLLANFLLWNKFPRPIDFGLWSCMVVNSSWFVGNFLILKLKVQILGTLLVLGKPERLVTLFGHVIWFSLGDISGCDICFVEAEIFRAVP